MPSWVRGEAKHLKSPLWDPARGVLIAERQKGSWRYLCHLAHRKPSPRGSPFPMGIQGPALLTGSLSPHICHCRPAVS